MTSDRREQLRATLGTAYTLERELGCRPAANEREAHMAFVAPVSRRLISA
jgi:hypothetical protein